jgi:tRNA(Ile)-lysidine synthase
VNNIFEKVDSFIIKNSLIVKKDKVLLALSGGKDSVFLFYYFIGRKDVYDFEFSCIYVNHNLRGNDSFNDEQFCKELCNKHNIPLYVCSIDVKKYASENKKSIEEAARELRYAKFKEIKDKNNFSKVATAHNLDDNIETLLLRLIEGTGLKGLCGIPPVRNDYVIRPLLGISKNEIVKYLNANNLEYVFDKSNDDINFRRNYIRHKLIPEIAGINPSYSTGIINTINILTGISEYYYNCIDELIRKFIKENEEQLIIDNRLFKLYNLIIYAECIKVCLEKSFNYRFDINDLEKLEGINNIQVGKYFELKDDFILFKDRTETFIFRSKGAGLLPTKLKIGDRIDFDGKKLYSKLYDIDEVNIKNKKRNEEFIDVTNVDINNLIIRNWKEGDCFIPLGMKGKKNVSDFLTDVKVNAIDKKKQKVLLNVNEIIYLIGYRISEKYKITEKTKKVLKIWID